jgi:hypothetical protein
VPLAACRVRSETDARLRVAAQRSTSVFPPKQMKTN